MVFDFLCDFSVLLKFTQHFHSLQFGLLNWNSFPLVSSDRKFEEFVEFIKKNFPQFAEARIVLFEHGSTKSFPVFTRVLNSAVDGVVFGEPRK